jgi:hypothetical protein
MEFQLFLIVVVIVLLVIVFSARRAGYRGGMRAGPQRQCPGCMAGIPAHAQFCPRCGRKQG